MPKNLSGETFESIKASGSTLAEAVMLVIFVVLFFWFLILPKKAALGTLNDQLVKTQNDQKVFAESVSKLEGLIAKLHQDYKEVDRLDQALPLDGSSIRLQLLVQSLGQSAGVVLGDISVSAGGGAVVSGDKALLANPYTSTRVIKKMIANVTAVGSYDQLKLFLEKIEQDARIMNITSLEISGYQSGQLSLQLSLEAYNYAP